MTWRYGTWTVEHALPVGAAGLAPEGTSVRSGDVIASGGVIARVHLVRGARHLGVDAADLDRVMRVRPGAEVRKGTVLARTGRRFARSVTSPIDGRLVHITADGDMCVASVPAEWRVRSVVDGVVTRSDAAAVTVDGDCWGLSGLAAYGPDAIGDLALAVDAPDEALSPSRIDVQLSGRILVGGARAAAEAITRAHACGVSGVVAGAAPAGGLRVVYGDGVGARGAPTGEDRPTVLCLAGFGSAPLPREVFDPLVALAGHRAAIHTGSATLFVMAPHAATRVATGVPALALAADHASVRLALPGEAGALPFDAER